MKDNSTKPELSIHMILGARDYERIKVREMPMIGSPRELLPELNCFGWVIMSPENEIDLSNLMLLWIYCY